MGARETEDVEEEERGDDSRLKIGEATCPSLLTRESIPEGHSQRNLLIGVLWRMDRVMEVGEEALSFSLIPTPSRRQNY